MDTAPLKFYVTIPTRHYEISTFYVGKFAKFSGSIGQWSSPIITSNAAPRNWAEYYLPELATQFLPLRFALSAYTASRMHDRVNAQHLHEKGVSLLCKSMSNVSVSKQSLGIWATALVLCESDSYNSHLEESKVHLRGAIQMLNQTPQDHRTGLAGSLLCETARLQRSVAMSHESESVLRCGLPHDPISLLLEQSNTCYHDVLSLLKRYFSGRLKDKALDQEVSAVLCTVAKYLKLLDLHDGSTRYLSCASPDFPFSPVIRYKDPYLTFPSLDAAVLLVMLAPFISASEHQNAVLTVLGSYAGLDTNLKLRNLLPLIYTASFLTEDVQRDWIKNECITMILDRESLFCIPINSLTDIWKRIDTEICEPHSKHRNIKIMAIAMEEVGNHIRK